MPKPFTIAEFNRCYPTEASCLRELFLLRYNYRQDCPKCHRVSRFTRLNRRKCFSCQWCGYQLSPLAGTIFHKSKTPLKKWFYAIFLMASSKNGVSAAELSRQLGVTYKCAYRMAQQIRTLFLEEYPVLSGEVEADESWFGHKGKKVAVAGLVERGGSIITKVIDDTTATTLIPWIEDNVMKGSALLTDEHRGYWPIGKRGYVHEMVNHKRYQWVNGRASTNTLEGHWGLMKRAIRGTYGSVSSRHLSLYVSEFSWRRNHRKERMFPLLLAEAAKPARVVF